MEREKAKVVEVDLWQCAARCMVPWLTAKIDAIDREQAALWRAGKLTAEKSGELFMRRRLLAQEITELEQKVISNGN